jgi:predicted DCC family thiol-disulfide oxidoreductase YuxK
LIFDGRCGFCRIWIEYWKKITGDALDYEPSQEAATRFPNIPREAFSEAVQLIRTDGSVASGARAVFETLGREHLYESLPLLAPVSEAAYRFIARHRDLFYWITRLTVGTDLQPARFADTQRLFLRALAVIYAIAFGSLATQIVGLAGAHGIAPLGEYMARIHNAFGSMGYLSLPTVFWLNPGDVPLRVLGWAGVALAALLLFDRMERFILLLLYLLYLSYDMAGQMFLSFQWDALLLEAGFLAIFFGRSITGERVIAWLYRCLLFRLYFLSGYVKLGSHDATWANLTALQYHFHTQPLPTIIAWYVDKLPAGLLHFWTGAVLAIELGAPFLIFGPRRWRRFGAFLLLGLQALIFLTGNYTFFNLLTVALTLFLFDDQALSGIARKLRIPRTLPAPSTKLARLGMAVLAVCLLTLGLGHLLQTIEGIPPEPLDTLVRISAPLQLVNSYGLFAVMTTTRPEIVIEGSDDGQNWKPYQFRYKPGALDRAPRWIQPFQPRLDWQMWFAALGTFQDSPWLPGFVIRLLQGSPDVLALLQTNPFPAHPPRLIRALLYDYSFTSMETRRQTGQWWERTPVGIFLPPVALKQPVSYSN